MNKTKIEWCDYTINPVKGLCPMGCSYCYARRMYKRFKWNPNIRVDWQETGKLPNKPSRIFVGSTMELFGDWVKPEWMREILKWPRRYPQHTFIFLTKCPQNLIKFSPFPKNCWIGVSATNEMMAGAGSAWLGKIVAPVKFLSLEPMISWDSENAFNSILRWHPENINWAIIGQQTPIKASTQPKIEWIREIVEACDKAKTPVFLKDNLKPILKDGWPNQPWAFVDGYYTSEEHPNIDRHLRQELPTK